MGNGLMAPDADKVFVAIGVLKSELSNLAEKFDDLNERITKEQRKVHDIVDATSEAMRNVVRTQDILQRIVEEMKPLTDDYRERRAELRGEEKFKKWLYGLIASAGAGAAVLLGKMIDWVSSRPHIPVVAVIVLALTLVVTVRANGHEWYPQWCCSGGDCGPLAGERVRPTADGYLVDGKFKVPLSEVRKSMDGRYHGCFPTDDQLKCFFAPPPGS